MTTQPTATAPIEITKALDGARVLVRHWTSAKPPREGFIREFSPAGDLVRISRTNRPSDAGLWHRTLELRVDAVLEPSRAPVAPRSRSSNGQLENEGAEEGDREL